ncbi:hypothetical protein [Phytohabitans kaempferiae]|uniref:Uncharacterized protein n=1 Tax=Phytohabitans kaempferiae TaxID=1620943 RepID=A0ABV6MBM5_9ACTN
MIARYLYAVLVDHTATIASIRLHLAGPMQPLVRAGQIRGYRYGGSFTGAWDRGYDPQLDPRNRRPCPDCAANTASDAGTCLTCTTGEPGTTVVADPKRWAPHPGDIVPLTQLLHPQWRYPKGTTPHAWVDLAGIVQIGPAPAATGENGDELTPPALLQVFDDLHTGSRDPHVAIPDWPHPRFDPAAWSVAVVDAGH